MDKQLDHWLVVTDLDGTLLNHHDYSFKEALSPLEKLEAHGIPVIINSSKTAAEIQQLRRELNTKLEFFDVLRKRHLHHTEGGRFIHLMGQTNKGSAMTWLARHHAKQYKKNIRIVALGDANNDIDMFTAADIAAVIKSPVNPPPEFDHNHKIMSTQTGAAGWAEVIESIFFKKQ